MYHKQLLRLDINNSATTTVSTTTTTTSATTATRTASAPAVRLSRWYKRSLTSLSQQTPPVSVQVQLVLRNHRFIPLFHAHVPQYHLLHQFPLCRTSPLLRSSVYLFTHTAAISLTYVLTPAGLNYVIVDVCICLSMFTVIL